ncbi:MAG: SPFH domain-containing protein [Clostridiales bacterium]|nr:SPFH domain-containing protein [Clostridiales bacterium]
MGLLKAGAGALGGALADSWREYFYCEALDADILMTKGVKRTGKRSSNTKGSDNIISNGSIIAVADGQCMMIVEQGKIVELCAESGEFLYDSSTEPTIMYGGLNKENIKKNLAVIGKRFTFGGEPPKDQRVYYFNTKEIIGNKYGTVNPIPFRVVDTNIGLDVDISLRCNGEYSYRMVDPTVFYKNVCGNVTDEFSRSAIDSQLKSELLTALQPAFAKMSELGIRYSAIPGHTDALADALNEVLSTKWTELRGLKVWSLGVNSITAPKEDEDMIKELQKNAVMRDPTMAAANITGAQAQAMRDAAKNPNGAFTGFMGMGFAQNAGGMNAANLFAMGQQPDRTPPQQQYGAAQGYAAPQQYNNNNNAAAANGWKCACGAVNTGKFCVECGKPQPSADGWTCACGAVNKGKFCSNCGAPKPAGAPLYKCDKCGWEPEDPHNPPKFCPQCGDPFNENDIK